MPEIEIDPTTRIEGHHSTTLQVEDGEVQHAKSHMDMFRGVELVTLDRPPSDAPQFTQMVCGVCFTCHRQTSILAIEDAAKRARGVDAVGLTGGVAYNDAIAGRVADRVRATDRAFLAPDRVPPGDAGVSYGQAVVASVRDDGR